MEMESLLQEKQINNKISNTEKVVASEMNDIKNLLQKTNSITKKGFSLETGLRLISTMMGMVVLFLSIRNDKRQSLKFKKESQSETNET